MTDERPALTVRAQKRLDAGATAGAGTDVCIKCDGPKAPRRVNSDKCSACNKPGYDSGRPPSQRGASIQRGVHYVPDPALYAALVAEADKRGMLLSEYIDNGMRRVIKKDAGWVAPNLIE